MCAAIQRDGQEGKGIRYRDDCCDYRYLSSLRKGSLTSLIMPVSAFSG